MGSTADVPELQPSSHSPQNDAPAAEGAAGALAGPALAAEPIQADKAVSRRSPRSADPAWVDWNSRAPPPMGIMPAGGAFGHPPERAPRHC
jgi:hypothetical protein